MMIKYEHLELEIKNIKVDIITASPTDLAQDTPGAGMTEDMLS